LTFQGRWFLASRGLALTVGLIGITGGAIEVSALPAGSLSTGSNSTIDIAQVGASVIYVNAALGQDAPTSGKTEATPLKTISYALQQAEPGTTIQLSSGSYTAQSGEVFPLILRPGVTAGMNRIKAPLRPSLAAAR
jgi:hypothetical protein